MTKRTRVIRDQEHKNVLTVILRKYDLLDDLDKLWALGVREVADIPWLTPDDIPLFDLKGTLNEYHHIYRQEKALEEAAEKAAKAAP